ncbi:MAG TPA: hypothetical protein VGE07_19280, partial [Herpetosiphonaceae bacterium]
MVPAQGFRRWLLFAMVLLLPFGGARAESPPGNQQFDLTGPAGSGTFGRDVAVLPNGNVVVTDPSYDLPNGTANVGAARLYDGATGALISELTGSQAGDQVGYHGVTILRNGNFLVRSAYWDNGALSDAGAVTWADGEQGVSGAVSAANSLVGSGALQFVGNDNQTVYALANGNYVVQVPTWSAPGANRAGAVAWGDGTRGVTGAVSVTNSLVGSRTGDQVGGGSYGLRPLPNGNYVVSSPGWSNGGLANAGAVTWGDGTRGITGTVSAANSLVGASAQDQVGSDQLMTLSNGNYLVPVPHWHTPGGAAAGALTWADASRPITGVVSIANSLVGTRPGDLGDWTDVARLANGNYALTSPFWDNGAIVNAGAVTWGDGTRGVTGAVSVTNSLVGTKANDFVGSIEVTPLANGNYVVSSPQWDNGAIVDAGAVTWADGSRGLAGAVSAANSLVGAKPGDFVGQTSGGIDTRGQVALANGNYVVRSPLWDNGSIVNAGAVTWGDGTRGVTGTVSVANSLVGGSAQDQVGYDWIIPVGAGNYAVASPLVDTGPITDTGAVTWGDGARGATGLVSAANSLVGTRTADHVGQRLTALANGNYAIISREWDNGAIADAGAVTWAGGDQPLAGGLSPANSLVGAKPGDFASALVDALPSGHYLVMTPRWDNGSIIDAGAATWGDGTRGVAGTISQATSLVGSNNNDRVAANYVPRGQTHALLSTVWDNGSIVDAGAVTFVDPAARPAGQIDARFSAVGRQTGSGPALKVAIDDQAGLAAVGWPQENRV